MRAGTIRPSRRASGPTVQPCTTSDTSTTMKAMLKMTRPFSSPPSSGVMASRIDTAPRRPTQEMKAISARGKRNGIRQSQTATGRATKIRNRPSSTAAEQDRRKLRRRREQAEDQEHDDLRQPRHAVLEALQDGDGADVGIAGNQAGEIDRQEAGAADGAGGGEHHQRQRQHEDRQQALVEIEPVDQPHDGEAAEHADDGAEAHMRRRSRGSRSTTSTSAAGSAPRAMISTSVMVRKMAIGSLVPDSTSSVARTRSRRLMLPARSRKNTAAASVEATAAPSRKDSSQVRSVQIVGGGAEQAGGQHDADGRQRQRRQRRLPQHALSGVPKPESNRMTASASEPTK